MITQEEALRAKIARQERQIELLEQMIEDRSRDIFVVNEELAKKNEQLEASMAEQQAMQKALIDASRKAGMADVATSVLHNVGNVLNSVNVSAAVVTNLLAGSKSNGVSKAVGLLREQADPGHFLTHDPRGKKLIDYLEVIGRAMDGERTKVLEELAALGRNIEHIIAIIGQQQSLARTSAGVGVVERVRVRELLGDAIRFTAASFERHGVEMTLDCDPALEVAVDRHKLFQILMNVITNASHAVKENAAGHRFVKVTVGVRQDEGSREAAAAAASSSVAIRVSDNGVGIEPENLEKIFRHGFTTKKGGHGFGLHSSACAAGELGGRMAVASDGRGKGATFTLEIPSGTAAAGSAGPSRRPPARAPRNAA